MKRGKKNTIKKSLTAGVIRKRRVPREFMEEFELYEYKPKVLKIHRKEILHNIITVSVNAHEVFDHSIYI
jgi:hypothetical protein